MPNEPSTKNCLRRGLLNEVTRSFNTEVHAAHALRSLGHTVREIDERTCPWRQIGRIQEQLLLWTHSHPGNHMDQERALATLRQRGVPTVSFHLDRWWGLSAREHQVAEDPFFRTDLVATADGGHADRFQSVGVRHQWLPPGVHAPEVGRGTARRELVSEIVFVGGDPYPHPEWATERAALVRYLSKRYGSAFKRWPVDKRQPIRGTDLNDLFASAKVIIGDSCLAGAASHYWSDRVPETLGRGGFLIHPYVDGISEWYEDGKHLLLFSLGDLDKLGRVVDDALRDDALRRQVTDAAIELVSGRDTYTHRMQTLLELAAADPVRRGWLDGRVGPVTLRHEGVTAKFDLRPATSDSVAVREVWQQGSYRLTADQIRGGVVVDVGGHVGSFSILAAKLGASRVIAFEPIPDSAEQFAHNVALNGLGDQIELSPCAVCDNEDTVSITVDGSGSHVMDSGDLVVPAVSLAQRLEDVDEIAVMKIDCEGCEYLSLQSLAEVLPKVNHLVMEFHGPKMPHMKHLTGHELGELCVVLAEHGIFEVVGRTSTGGMIYWKRHR